MTGEIMHKREWLAHAALRATYDALGEPNNPKILQAMRDATLALCPDCAHGIVYCRCFEASPSLASAPNKPRRART